MTIRLQLFIGFLVLILVLIVLFFVNQRLSAQILQNSTYLNNSEAVIRNSNILHKQVIDMQSGFRGYLLTRQEVFLQPYYHGVNSIPPLIKEQRGLLSTESQKQKLDSIDFLHQEWVEYADSLISTKRDTLPESNLRYESLFNRKLKMEVGKKLNDRIRDIFISLDNYEYAVRLARRAKLQQSVERTGKISILLTIVSIILASITSFLVTRSITRRISKMVNLSERVSKGDFINIKDDKKDELSRLVNSLNSMSVDLNKNFNELQKKNQQLDEFAYVVSHDLKAPLRGIANIISWIEEDHKTELSGDVVRNLELIKGRTDRLENMINGLLEYARIGKTKAVPETVDVKLLLSDLQQILVPRDVKVSFLTPFPIIKTEKVRLEQVFSNLLSNAIKYNKSVDREIKIGCYDEADHYKFTVTDNGPGIEKEYYEKIFMIFQTLQERDAFESTGVGLAIVKKIVEENKGTIIVESTIGQGTTFIFTWPKETKEI
jgi:signal transduction histidine kinase